MWRNISRRFKRIHWLQEKLVQKKQFAPVNDVILAYLLTSLFRPNFFYFCISLQKDEKQSDSQILDLISYETSIDANDQWCSYIGAMRFRVPCPSNSWNFNIDQKSRLNWTYGNFFHFQNKYDRWQPYFNHDNSVGRNSKVKSREFSEILSVGSRCCSFNG